MLIIFGMIQNINPQKILLSSIKFSQFNKNKKLNVQFNIILLFGFIFLFVENIIYIIKNWCYLPLKTIIRYQLFHLPFVT